MEKGYELIESESGVPIKAWTKGVAIEAAAEKQLRNVASLPFVYKWVAAMPDVHWGIGATVGSVIPTKGAIIPAAVGVDIGCGMMAVQTTLNANQLPDNLQRAAHGDRESCSARTHRQWWPKGQRGALARCSRSGRSACGASLQTGYNAIIDKYPQARPRQQREPSRHARDRQSFYRSLLG